MDEYYTVSEYADLTGRDPSHIRRMLIYGKIAGEKLGKQWIIPKGTEYPKDNRVKSGNYRNWRRKTNDNPIDAEFFALLNRVCKSLSDLYGEKLEKVILYGSYARGEQTKESDADLAVILREDVTEDIHDKMIDILVDYELECGVTLSAVQIDNANYIQWNKTLPYYKNIEKEGIILWKAA
ncbi:MAG: nucleotidyltransferase domain-containing protein [Lachnospiraceae bacterium]|nr:nucleotidyltransferase domain-containing protein [Lachnospiraceae bacterium]